MIEWVATDAGVRAVAAGATVTIEASDWRADGVAHDLPRADAAVGGSASALALPARRASLAADGWAARREVSAPLDLPPGDYLLVCDAGEAATPPPAGPNAGTGADGETGVRGGADAHTDAGMAADADASGGAGIPTYVRFSGPVSLRPDGDGIALTFPDRGAVTVGFRRPGEGPPETVTVPQTPAGVATALSHLSAALRTIGPERSHPGFRAHPPLVASGDEVDVPAEVATATPEVGIDLRLPPCLEHLYVAAPLAYYLGAGVEVEDRDAPVLCAPGADLEREFAPMPAFQREAAAMLRRVFTLDCLVRDVGVEPPLRDDGLLGSFGIDPPAARKAAPAVRLAEYLRADDPPELPDWHLSTYVAPEPEHARCLPYLLDNLSLVYMPDASDLDGKELLRRTLDDFYRGEVASPDVLDPRLGAGQLHGWLAEGTPIDAFKTTLRAYENRRLYDRPRDVRVTVVLNDPEMGDEQADVADIYRRRAADLPVEVTVRESLTRRELADVFAAPTDFVHYIGHCEVDGLRCTDGALSVADLERARARTFFLNACGSYHEGLALVERGSVAGAVTLTKVLDAQAAKVGTAFARLLIHGFGIERAMQLSRRRIMMGKDYAVVGDGTYALVPCADHDPAVVWLEDAPDGYRVAYELSTARAPGGSYRAPFEEDARLYGTVAETTLTGSALAEALDGTALPVIYDGEFHWSDEVVSRLRR